MGEFWLVGVVSSDLQGLEDFGVVMGFRARGRWVGGKEVFCQVVTFGVG